MLEAGVPHDGCPKESRWKTSPVGVADCAKSHSFLQEKGTAKKDITTVLHAEELGSSLGCHLWQHPRYALHCNASCSLMVGCHCECSCLSCDAGLGYTAVEVEA